MAEWSLLTNHANVLVCVTREPDIRLRELAIKVGISERAVKRIVADLEKAGYLERERHGRRNHYNVNAQAPLAGPVTQGLQVSALLTALMALAQTL
ncbi:MAG TPA: MarR family transcriptional regulator [Tepidiformaceae bacterium]|nr:MarR family transcriptional regulator [Tepidiformaceae bacterium]HMO96520.1 MarR family transcriptional regulator [Tepidiformaceae bacterium]